MITFLLWSAVFFLGAMVGVALMCLLQINQPDPEPQTLRPDAAGSVRLHLHREEP